MAKTKVMQDFAAAVRGEKSGLYHGPLISGFHIVDRVGYIVTEVPWEEETEVKI